MRAARDSQTLRDAIAYEKDKPFDRDRLIRALFKFDPGCLLHGVFLESIAGVLRVPRALSGFIEATNIQEVASGGVKNDRVQATTGEKNSGQTAKDGYGNVPFHRTEFTAKQIDAYFNVDVGQLRSYKLGEDAERLLYALAVYKIRSFLERGLRLRTACDFDANELHVTRPSGFELPSFSEAEAAIRMLIPQVANQRRFADPPISRANYDPKYKAETGEASAKSPAKPKSKGAGKG